ncbi:Tetratricopeptide repeat family [Ectocarpus siliculosus]|uniref:Tetratricopeptide repeat family n=1 Tax=Ectocarpus siliculosus TaxID=2880 RepID=D7FGQ2_ECTSI|nr:Tetratricopeptide repeat family [Ectocarpus siliculosus]|eukprot:CBJ28328.1 Tetratricopeptide repeat family [Ectocarpus siliculosus]
MAQQPGGVVGQAGLRTGVSFSALHLTRPQEHYVEAIPLFERALSIRTRKLGGSHPDTAGTRNGLDVVRRKARLELVRIEGNPLAPLLARRPGT